MCQWEIVQVISTHGHSLKRSFTLINLTTSFFLQFEFLLRFNSSLILKLADFGIAKMKKENSNFKTFCGTPNYLAPEIWRTPVRENIIYTTMADNWSIGCVLYTMLTCTMAFDKWDDDFLKKVDAVNYKPPCRQGVPVSAEAADLIKKLMVFRASDRLTATQALQHPWMLMGPNDVARAKNTIKVYSRTQIDHVDEVVPEPHQEEEELEIVVNENLPKNPPDANGPDESNEAKRIRLM